jgi:hypothetical protein
MDEALKRLDVEKLGRERPVIFVSAWREVAFASSLLVSLTMSVSEARS